MALPHLIKHIYNSGTDEVIRRGKKIHLLAYVEMTDHDDLMNNVTFRVRDDMYNSFYKVVIEKYNDAKGISMRCSCPYNLTEICRHEVASLFRLQDMIDKKMLGNSDTVYNQKHTVAKMKHIDLKLIRIISDKIDYEAAEIFLLKKKAKITRAADEKVEAVLNLNGEKFNLLIQKNEERYFDTSCNCTDTSQPLCVHKIILFLQLFQESGPHYFDSIRNWDKEKSKLLQIYGYSLNDDLEGKFEFSYKEGKPFMKVLDTSIKRVAAPIPQIKTFEPQQIKTETAELNPEEEVSADSFSKRLGLVFNFNEKNFPGFSVAAIKGEPDEASKNYLGKTEVLDLTKFVNTKFFRKKINTFFKV